VASGRPDGNQVLKKIGLWSGLSAGGGAVAAVGVGLAAPAVLGAAAVAGLAAGFVVLVSSFSSKK
jgi:hypothetical protein